MVNSPDLPEAIIEFIPQGRFVKVTAIDPHTGIEATIVGDPNASQDTLKNLAARKLLFVMNKKS
jgi:hypothetical protein